MKHKRSCLEYCIEKEMQIHYWNRAFFGIQNQGRTTVMMMFNEE